jgi:hypothetical protein
MRRNAVSKRLQYQFGRKWKPPLRGHLGYFGIPEWYCSYCPTNRTRMEISEFS